MNVPFTFFVIVLYWQEKDFAVFSMLSVSVKRFTYRFLIIAGWVQVAHWNWAGIGKRKCEKELC